jgi:hypothetical protein
MNLRYAGFEQVENHRLYAFECAVHGRLSVRVVVRADLALFGALGVSIQEGPVICARKLQGSREPAPAHELTVEDLRAHAACLAEDAARKSASKRRRFRRMPGRRPRSLNSGHWGSASSPAPRRERLLPPHYTGST